MSLSQQTMLELMAYADGELDEKDRARIEQLLASSEDARRLVGAVNDLGEWVAETYEQPPALLSNGIAGAVMARVMALPESAPALKAGGVIDLAAARRTRLAAVAVAVVALAAGVMLYARDSHDTQTAGLSQSRQPPAVLMPAPLPPVPEVEVAAARGVGVDVDQLESPSHEVSVFYLPAVAAANASSVVVWIGDDDKGGH